MLDWRCGLHCFRRIFAVVVSVVGVLILVTVMRTRVPAASAPIGSVGDCSDCQRRYDAQRRGGAPALFKLEIRFHSRPLLKVKFTPVYLIVEHDAGVSDSLKLENKFTNDLILFAKKSCASLLRTSLRTQLAHPEIAPVGSRKLSDVTGDRCASFAGLAAGLRSERHGLRD